MSLPIYRCPECENTVPALLVEDSRQVSGTTAPVAVVRPVEVLCTNHEHPYMMRRVEG